MSFSSSPPCGRRSCRPVSSTPNWCATSPGAPVLPPRPTAWTLRSWPCLPAACGPNPGPCPRLQQQELKHLMTRRRQLLDMIQMEKNRLDPTPLPRIAQSIQQTIKSLEDQLAALNREIDDFFHQHPRLAGAGQDAYQRPGHRPPLRPDLIAYLPELGTPQPQRDRRPGGRGSL